MPAQKLVPNKNHKTLLKELCGLITDYGKLNDLRNKEEVTALLLNRVPKILNNFDKSDPSYPAIEGLLSDIIENLGIVIKLAKE